MKNRIISTRLSMNSRVIVKAGAVALSLLLSFLSTQAFAATDANGKVYYLYGDSRPGSKFKQKLFTDMVPFDKTYEELSQPLQNRVKAAYGGLKESEHPPYPSEGSQAIYRPLFKANRNVRAEGEVLAVAVISATGDVKSVAVYKAPKQNIATMLNYIITNTKFDPATCDGEPCEMEYLFENKIDFMPSTAR